jgi:hypothetical protein
MNLFRQIARWTALLLLVNIGLGFCDCLREPVAPGGVASKPHATAPPSHTNDEAAPDCGDNCESCICHANLVVAEPLRFAVVLAVSGTPISPAIPASDPMLIGITHPPRM